MRHGKLDLVIATDRLLEPVSVGRYEHVWIEPEEKTKH